MSRHRADRIQGYRGRKGVLIVPGQFNGGFRRQLLVDTGATFTVITQKLAQEMGVATASNTRRLCPSSHTSSFSANRFFTSWR